MSFLRIQETAKSAHQPIVPQGSTEERCALSWGEVKAPPERIIEISRVMHSVTGYKNSVTMARPMSGEVATQTMTAPRRRGGQLRRFAPVWGGKPLQPRLFHISASSRRKGTHLWNLPLWPVEQRRYLSREL